MGRLIEGRRPAYPLSILGVVVLAVATAALLGLLPADPAQAQDDAARPEITAGPVITSNPASGDTYGKGEKIVVSVTFGEPVTVTGEPRLRLAIGDNKRWAKYDRSGKKGARLFFSYKVKAADSDDNGVSIKKNSIDLNGGAIEDAGGNRARLRHSKVSDQAGHKVNGSPAEPEPEPTPTPTPEPTPEPTPTPEPASNNEPQFAAETAARSVPENSAAGTSVGDPVTANDGDDDDILTYALTGSDDFTIDDAGRITVAPGATLDYESQASYSVTVTVHDGLTADGTADSSVDDTIAVTISVTNVEEAGVVSLVSETEPPQVGSPLSASLSDPDGGVTGLAWAWERSSDGSAWEAIAGVDQSAYTPSDDDAGKYLRATAGYADAQGGGKTARAATTATVAAAIVDEPPSVVEGPILNSPQSGDAYGKGEEINVSLTFSEPVTVSGKPQVALTIGESRRWAEYRESVAGDATLVFAYTVKDADRDADGLSIEQNALELNGGSIEDAGGNAASLEHPALADLDSHKVDGAGLTGERQTTETGPTSQTVAANWTYIPTDSKGEPIFTVGQSFRLLFVTSVTQDPTAMDIATYNSLVQTQAATNTALASFSGQFRALISTSGRSGVDARDNTATTYTTEDKGVPIYWLGGTKVADNYRDFYNNDGWDSLKRTNESGSGRGVKSQVWTGSEPDGTKHSAGAGRSTTRVGSLSPTDFRVGGGTCVISCTSVLHSSADLPYYALSPVLTVVNTAPSFSLTDTTRNVDENSAAGVNVGDAIPAATDPDSGDTLTYSFGGTDTASFEFDPSTRRITVKSGTALDYETRRTYSVTVGVSDGKKADGTDSATVDDTIAVTINVNDVNEPPAFSSSATVNAVENRTMAVTVAATDEDAADSVAYAITGGADKSKFRIGKTNGKLRFKTAPDFENPKGGGENNVYNVTVRATGGKGDRAMMAKQTIVVTVTNEDEDGTVSFSSTTPTVGTALTATPADPDGSVSGTTWQWASSDSQGGTFADITGATSASYTPVAADVGKWLKATASYADGHGSGKSASQVTTATVAGCAGSTATPFTTASAGLVADCELLLGAKDALLGTTSTTLNWTTSVAVADWNGVTVRDGRVTELDLSGQELKGKLPDALGGLSALEGLDLSNNALTGSLPADFARLSNLGWLYLNDNALTGGIPAEWAETSNPTNDPDLDLGYAALNRTHLWDVNLTGNDLTGTVTLTLTPAAGVSAAAISEGGGTQTVTVTVTLDQGSAWAHHYAWKPTTLTVTVSGSGVTGAVDFTPVADFPIVIDLAHGIYGYASVDFDLEPVVQSGAQTDETVTVSATGTGAKSSADLALTSNSPTLTLIDGTPANVNPRYSETATTLRVEENSAEGTAIGVPLVAVDADGDTLTYALAGEDAVCFDIDTATGQINVQADPDVDMVHCKRAPFWWLGHYYEAAGYLGLDREAVNNKWRYSVTVTVTDGKDAAGNADAVVDDTIAVTIEVTDVDIEGGVSFNPEIPQVGESLSARLVDIDHDIRLDSIEVVEWERLDSPTAASGTTIDGENKDTYTPVEADVGKWLRVTFNYIDQPSLGKKEISAVTANAVE